MKQIQTEIVAVEQELGALRISVNALCREAGIDRSTWHRWKAGATQPTDTTWGRVQAARLRLVRRTA